MGVEAVHSHGIFPVAPVAPPVIVLSVAISRAAPLYRKGVCKFHVTHPAVAGTLNAEFEYTGVNALVIPAHVIVVGSRATLLLLFISILKLVGIKKLFVFSLLN